jgi:hypothetical protein
MARHLDDTGHIAFNGWATAMLGSQLYIGAAFIKLLGFTFTTVRISTLLVATAIAFVLQRTFSRAGISERNATIGTLALVFSPLYLTLSVTFMSDIFGLFAVVVCLYGCLRALQASATGAVIGWLCFALPATFPVARMLSEFIHFYLDIPFLMLPIIALFLPKFGGAAVVLERRFPLFLSAISCW